jgi:hypothetical protein
MMFMGSSAHSTGDYVQAAGESVDEHSFATAWAEGRAMTLEQAVEYALSADV